MTTGQSYPTQTSALILVDVLNDLLAEDGKLAGQIGPMLAKLDEFLRSVRAPAAWRIARGRDRAPARLRFQQRLERREVARDPAGVAREALIAHVRLAQQGEAHRRAGA